MKSRDAYALACWHTIRTLRRHPELQDWLAKRPVDTDSAHRAVIKRWLEQVAPYLDRAGRHDPDEVADKLLDACQGYLDEGQYEDLAATWARVTGSIRWWTLKPTARWLYRALHALAQERDRRGGTSVLLAHRPALALIEILGGPRYKTLATVTNARTELIAALLVDVKVGQKHERGKKSRPTRYTILPADGLPLSELSLYADRSELSLLAPRDSSLVFSAKQLHGSAELIPRLSVEQRAALEGAFTRSQEHRKAASDSDVEPPEVPSTWDYSALLPPECMKKPLEV